MSVHIVSIHYFDFKFTFLGANQTHTLICTYFVFQPTVKAQKIRRRYKDGERKTRNRLKCLFRGGRFLSGSFICLFAVCVAFVHAVVVLCVCVCVCGYCHYGPINYFSDLFFIFLLKNAGIRNQRGGIKAGDLELGYSMDT